MEHLTFREVLQRGTQEVIVQSYGYDEGRVCPCYQPFAHKKNITFKVKIWEPTEADPTLDGYLENRTFWLKEDESNLDYILKDDGKVYLDDPNIGADIDY